MQHSKRLCFYFRIILPLLILFAPKDSVAQDRHLMDSLGKVINTAKDAKQKIDALNAYAYENRLGNIDSGKLMAKQAYELSKEINYHSGIGDSYDCLTAFYLHGNADSSIYYCYQAIAEYKLDGNFKGVAQQDANLGNAFLMTGQYDSGLAHTRKALSWIDNSKEMTKEIAEHKKMWLYQGLGTLFYYMSYYDSSVIYTQKSLAIAEKTGDKNAQSANLISIANVYAQQGENERAIAYEQKAATLQLQMNDYKGYILCLSNIGTHFASLKNYEMAKSYADSAVAEGMRKKFYVYMAHNYQTYGDIEIAGHNCKKALHYYDTGLKYCKQFRNDFLEYGLLRNTGDVYLCIGNPQQAKNYYLQSLKRCGDDRESMQLSYDGLSDVYEQLGNPREALRYARLSAALKDSIFSQDTKETINNLNIKYETGKKEQQIQLLSKENELKEARTQKQMQQKNFAYIAFIALLSFGGYSFYRYRRIKNIENDRAILKERLRLSKDLHDDIGATLSSISVYSTAVMQQLKDGRTGEAQRMLETISEDAREMVTNMGDMVWIINPQSVTVEKLFDRVQQFALNVFSAKNIVFHFNIDEELKPLTLGAVARKNIFLISKEAINNVIKYAECRNIYFSVERQENKMQVKIEDDGKGFDVNELLPGNGLKNMRQRAEELGGTFDLVSVPANSTRLCFLFDIPKIGD